MTKVEFEHATFDGSGPMRMDYERKLPEPVAWMLNGEFCAVQQCRLFSYRPGEVIPGQEPLFTEAQLREALASYEAVMRQAKEALEVIHDKSVFEHAMPADHYAAECAGQAIKALEGMLNESTKSTRPTLPDHRRPYGIQWRGPGAQLWQRGRHHVHARRKGGS